MLSLNFCWIYLRLVIANHQSSEMGSSFTFLLHTHPEETSVVWRAMDDSSTRSLIDFLLIRTKWEYLSGVSSLASMVSGGLNSFLSSCGRAHNRRI